MTEPLRFGNGQVRATGGGAVFSYDGTSVTPGGAQTVTVISGTNCTDNQPTGAAVATFTNAPLADIQVDFRGGGSGETSRDP